MSNIMHKSCMHTSTINILQAKDCINNMSENAKTGHSPCKFMDPAHLKGVFTQYIHN